MTDLDERLTRTLGRAAATFERDLGLRTTWDLLTHYPRRYTRRGELTRLDSLQVDEQVTVQARVARVASRRMRQRKGSIVEAVVTDGTGSLTLTFFNQRWREEHLRPGRLGLFAGKVTAYGRRRQLAHPDYLLIDDEPDPAEAGAVDFAGGLIPVYPATAALPSWRIARCVDLVLAGFSLDVDPVPAEVLARHDLTDLESALRLVHRPQSEADVSRARDRLVWDEAFLLQTRLAQRRRAARERPATPRVATPGGLLDAFDARLPFALTAGQRGIGETLAAELGQPHPMHRLLQGEVGSGKTVVALRAMLAVVDCRGQAALLAPTEVLAQQHHRAIRALLGPLGNAGELGADDRATRVGLLTGSLSAGVRRAALAEVADGSTGIVVGTHALLEEAVDFADLGLVVIDEQHRFGVEQRDALRAKGAAPPHLLVMTATPIPRTVAMTVFGDLETSTLRELPAGRAQIESFLVPAGQPAWVERMWARVRQEVGAGHAAYVVCPRIEEPTDPTSGTEAPAGRTGEDEVDEVDEVAGVDEVGEDAGAGGQPEAPDGSPRRAGAGVLATAAELAAGPLADLRIGVLHGRLPATDKDTVMRSFATGGLDVLVATTVVEVGVDVAHATVMVVLDADRFGVSQLHQLRGRVGRASAPSWCLLQTAAEPGTPGYERVAAVAATRDGFALARLDLQTRREGNVLGAEQSGRRSGLKLLSLLRDEEVLRAARAEASTLVEDDPALVRSPALAAAVARVAPQERAEYLEKT